MLSALLALSTLALAAPVEVASHPGANIQRPLWSPDGKLLAYEANFHEQQRIELYAGTAKPQGFQRVKPASRGLDARAAGFGSSSAADTRVAHELCWAPPSVSGFAYSAVNSDQDFEVFVASGTAIAIGPGTDGGPAWSADGRWLAFTSARTGQGDVYLADLTQLSTPPRRLSSDPTSAELFLDWSPAAPALVWVGHSEDAGDDLWLLSDLQGAAVRLTTSGAATRPSFSPDGRSIAYYSAAHVDGGTRWDLYIVQAHAGAPPQKLAEGVVPNSAGPVWYPDSSALLTVLDDDAAYDPIAKVGLQALQPTRLDIGTVGNGDLDLVQGADGKLRVAVVAQGRAQDTERSFKRLFVAEL